MRRIISVFLLIILTSCAIIPPFSPAAQDSSPRNVILFIGDGMGIPQITLARLAIYGKDGSLALDKFPVTGFVKTHSLNSIVTDSAAAATAIATGQKVDNFVVGVSRQEKRIEILSEIFKKNGKSVGIVTTSRITHATPAAFYARLANRNQEKIAALQLIESDVDIILGGGRRFFEQDMLEKMQKRGYKIAYTKKELEKCKDGKILGLFNESHINYVIDRTPEEPSLLEMTKKAIEVLSKNNKGFFLVVEGARIDHACHSYDAATCILEMQEFDETIKWCLESFDKSQDTLLVVVADHATGGLTITESANTMLENYKKVKASADKIERSISKGEIKFTEALLKYAQIPSVEQNYLLMFEKAPNHYLRATIIGEIISQNCGITFIPLDYRMKKLEGLASTHGHDAQMVPIYASGPGSLEFCSTMDNTQIFTKILKVTKLQ